jgi:hypothetical protein
MIKCLTRYIIRYKFSKAATSLIANDLTRYINDNAIGGTDETQMISRKGAKARSI